jgi:hypothetical protein
MAKKPLKFYGVYPPGAPLDSLCTIDDCGLTPEERKNLLKLRKLPAGVEVREGAVVMVNGEERLEYTNRETFEFFDSQTGFRCLFDIRAITDAAVKGEIPSHVGRVDFTMDSYLTFMQEGGVEEEHIARIDDKRLKVPGIYITWPTGEMTIIDGRHRVVKRFRIGKPHHRMIVIRDPYWRPFLLDMTRTVHYNPVKVRA